MIDESDIMNCNDANWPEPTNDTKQELEIKYNGQHIAFNVFNLFLKIVL